MPADMVAEPSVAKAVELMTKAEVWTSGSPVEPSAFGLSSLSVRAIVTAMTSQMGVQACDSKNPAELLRLCADKITGILAKGGAAGGGGGGGVASSAMSTIAAVNPSFPSPSSPAAASASGGGGGGDASASGGMSPIALLDVSGALADRQSQCEEAMYQWLFINTPGIHPDTSRTYAQGFYAAKMTTIERVAKKVGKEPGVLLSLGVEEDDAEDIVQAMRDASMLTA